MKKTIATQIHSHLINNDNIDIAAFDTIDHENLFCMLEKYVGICGNALKLIKSYFSYRTQRVQIDNVLSDFANIICGVPQGSVLGSLKLGLYLLPLSAISRYHILVTMFMLTTLNYMSHLNVNSRWRQFQN